LKAWAVTDRNDPLYTNIVFAETRGGALFIVPQHMEQAKQPEKSAD
jgi:hypothetical protein